MLRHMTSNNSSSGAAKYEMQQLLLLQKPVEEEEVDDCNGNIEDADLRQQCHESCVRCGDVYGSAPRLLSCLHVICQQCYVTMLSPETADWQRSPLAERGSPSLLSGLAHVTQGSKKDSVHCPKCKQITLSGLSEILSSKEGMSRSTADAELKTGELNSLRAESIVCTSCKAKEAAVARCADCDSYICPNCVAAHQYMRCFENHKVVLLGNGYEWQTSGEAPNAVRHCTVHPQVPLNLFCRTCQEPACDQCVAAGDMHRAAGHQCERLSSAVEQREANELILLISEARSKVRLCEEASSDLQTILTSLQTQRDDAKSRLFETLQSYKAIIEKRHEALVTELEEVHAEQELAVMEDLEILNRTIEQIEDGCSFADSIIRKGDGKELLFLKKKIAAQLLSLINNLPKCDEISGTRITFHTEPAKFAAAVEGAFGCVKSHSLCRRANSASSGSSCVAQDGAASVSSAAVLQPLSDAGVLTSELVPAVSLVSAQCAEGVCSGIAASNNVLPQPAMGNVMSPALHVPQEPSSALAYLRTGALSAASCNPGERAVSRQSLSPTMSDSGIGMDAPAMPFHGAGATHLQLAELAVLSKVGSLTIGPQGQVMVNGQPLSGLAVNTPARSSENELAMSGVALGGGLAATVRHELPNLDNLTGLIGSQQHSVQSSGAPPSSATIVAPGAGAILGASASSARSFSPSRHPPILVRSQSKMSAMQIRCKFGQLGPGKGQFNSPHGFCLGCDEDIIVADTNNHRVQVFDKTGEFKYQFGIPGREEGQLWYPRKVAVMRSSGRYVVCDRGNERSRMQIFTKNGHFLKKIAIRYIDIVAGLAITNQGHIVAVDSVSPTVFCISEAGDLLKWFDCSDYMREPSDIAINGKEYFVCDFKGHCVVVFNEDGQFLRRIGTDVITNFPNGIDISDAGDILVGDSHGNRFHVAVFQREGFLIGEFECPYVKVSRCCGLKITSEGYVVTLAKNNHHVLILNTLYIA